MCCCGISRLIRRLDRIQMRAAARYYVTAHASKFVPDGSVRIGSEPSDALPNVAFKTPQGKTVLLVANTGTAAAEFSVRYHGKVLKTSLGAGSVGTYVW